MTDAPQNLLAQSPRLAILGAHVEEHRPAHWVPDYLWKAGYQVVGVNPLLEGLELFGRVVVGTLEEAPWPVDGVVIFRRSALVQAHVPEILRMMPPPQWVWMQSGVRDSSAAKRLEDAGLAVVQDQCTYAVHRQHQLGRPRERQPESPGGKSE
jgi:predicted CoA-binding protein